MQPKKVLILTAKFGGGHRNSARIVQDLLAQNNIESKIWDLTEPLKKLNGKSALEWYYYFTAIKFPIIWDLTVLLGMITPRWLFLAFFAAQTQKYLAKEIQNFKPDAVISTYGHLGALVERIDPSIKVTTIVSDAFTPVFYWFLGYTDRLLVMSQKVLDYAKNRQIKEHRIALMDPLVNPKFLISLDRRLLNKMKQDLNLKGAKTILILAGGEGLVGAFKMVKNITSELPHSNLLVICGKDVKLKTDLEKFKTLTSSQNLHLYGFIDHVYELINLADVVISKAGPATILETLALQKPIILTSYYMQEKGNVDFVLENKYGFYEPNLNKLPILVSRIVHGKVKAENTWVPNYNAEEFLKSLVG